MKTIDGKTGEVYWGVPYVRLDLGQPLSSVIEQPVEVQAEWFEGTIASFLHFRERMPNGEFGEPEARGFRELFPTKEEALYSFRTQLVEALQSLTKTLKDTYRIDGSSTCPGS